jgi:hypothetical protein
MALRYIEAAHNANEGTARLKLRSLPERFCIILLLILRGHTPVRHLSQLKFIPLTLRRLFSAKQQSRVYLITPPQDRLDHSPCFYSYTCGFAKLKLSQPILVFNSKPIALAALLFSRAGKVESIA